MLTRSLIGALLLSAGALTQANAGNLHVGAGQTYTTIEAAVAAAAAGDVLLVDPGLYTTTAGPLVINKTLTIIGSGSDNTYLEGYVLGGTTGSFPLTVSGLSAAEEVRLVGISLFTEAGTKVAMQITGCSGKVALADIKAVVPGPGLSQWGSSSSVCTIIDSDQVILDGCLWEAAIPNPIAAVQKPKAGLTITNSTVLMTGCTVMGENANAEQINAQLGFDPIDGGVGLLATNSEVHIERSLIIGGSGSTAVSAAQAGAGGVGLRATSCELLIRGGAGNAIQGGAGGTIVGSPPSPGGVGLHASSGIALVTSSDANLNAGVDSDGATSQPALIAGVHTSLGVRLVSMDVTPNVAALGGSLSVALEGPQSSPCAVAFSIGQTPLFQPAWAYGPVALDTGAMFVFPTQALDMNGLTGFSIPVPSGSVFLGLSMIFQAFSVGTTGTSSLSAPSVVALH